MRRCRGERSIREKVNTKHEQAATAQLARALGAGWRRRQGAERLEGRRQADVLGHTNLFTSVAV
jgi:hypothetical protein